MILKRIFRTYTFRFSFFYVLLISVCSSVICGLIYRSVAIDYFYNVGQSVDQHLHSALASFNQKEDINAFQHFVDKSTADETERYYFVLKDANQKILAGNLRIWPEYTPVDESFSRFQSSIFGVEVNKAFLGRAITLPSGHTLLVARNYEDVGSRVSLVAQMLLYVTLLMVFLGVIGGAMISALIVERVDTLNRSISAIMHGNLSERLVVTSRGGEIDELASQLNKMLDRIQDSMNDVRQVSDNIAHDLRTPLTRLRNKLSLLGAQSAPEHRDLIREMLLESDQLLSIFSSLLRIAQVESGTKKSNFTDIDITKIFVDVVELYEPLASVNSLLLEIDRADACHLRGDKDLIFQMLVNLLDNAIKYTPEGGSIKTALIVENKTLKIIFADNGPGIPTEKYTKVFQRFYRVEESRGVQPGNGLGLSLVYAVTVLHGGKVQLSDGRAYHPDSLTPGLQMTIEIPLV